MSPISARSVRLAICAALVFVAGCSVSTKAKATPTVAPTASFAAAACPFTLGSGLTNGQNVRCGYLSVPEDWEHSTGKTIKLAVADFLGPDASAHQNPIIYLNGGPGGALLSTLANQLSSQLVPEIFGDHDVVMFDQRGVGYSQPSLACPEAFSEQIAVLDENLSVQQSDQQFNQALTQCYNRLAGQGIDLNAYSTYEDAADVHALIAGLGYQKAELYGVSYGTRLAQEVMRAFPQGIESVVLDSTVPPSLSIIADPLASMGHDFGVLFQGCAASATCNAKYPDLAATFYSLYATLQATPLTVQLTDPNTNKSYQAIFNGDALVGLLFQSLYVTSFIPTLPQMIAQIKSGDTSLLVKYEDIFYFDTSVSDGMYQAVSCGEDAPYTTDQTITQDAQALDSTIRPDEVQSADDQLAECANWHIAPVDQIQKQPVTSAIPTLILEGEYDPITPLADGQLVAQTLSHSKVLLFPGTGHGVFLTALCPIQIVQAFWSNPQQWPDTSCINSIGEPSWT
jgi:pimeloyl-ACP methyl ester carboxylesterase